MGILLAIGGFGALIALGGALIVGAKRIDSSVDGRDPRTGVGIRWKARDREHLMTTWLRALADVARVLDAEGAAAHFWRPGQALGAIRGSRVEVLDGLWDTAVGEAAGELRGRTVVVALLGAGKPSEGALAHEWLHLVLETLTGHEGRHTPPEQALVSRVNARLKAIGL